MAYLPAWTFDAFAAVAMAPPTPLRYKLATGELMREYQHRASHQLFTGKHIIEYETGRIMWERPERVGTAVHIDMGLGKTIIALTTIVDWFAFGIITKPVIVIAPIKVCETVWRQEAAEWSHTRHLTFSLIRGDEKKRAFALARPAHVYLVNPELVPWLQQYLRGDWSKFDALLIDDCPVFRSSKSKTFKKLTNYGTREAQKDAWGIAIRDNLGHIVTIPPHTFKRVGVMTGTPSPSGYHNLWGPYYICDHGARLHRKFETFEHRYFHKGAQVAEHVWKQELNAEEGEKRPDYVAIQGAPEKIHERVADITVELNAADYGVLPQTLGDATKAPRDERGRVIYTPSHHHFVDMPHALREQYDTLERDAILELQKDVLMAQNGGAKSMMCWQFANGAIYHTDDFGRKEARPLHDAKLDKCVGLCDELNANILIPYWFQHDLARLKARFEREGMAYVVLSGRRTEEIVDRWNGGYIPIMLLHPQSAGHGLNLQFGGHNLLWFSMLWSLEKYLQTNARLARSGQKGIVGIHSILTRATTDELMFANLGERGDLQTRFRSALRSYQELRQLGLYSPSPFTGVDL